MHNGKSAPPASVRPQVLPEGHKTYYIKASEFKDKLEAMVACGNASRAVGTLAKPSCLIIDGVGSCEFDKAPVFMILAPRCRCREFEFDTFSIEVVQQATCSRLCRRKLELSRNDKETTVDASTPSEGRDAS